MNVSLKVALARTWICNLTNSISSGTKRHYGKILFFFPQLIFFTRRIKKKNFLSTVPRYSNFWNTRFCIF